MKSQLRTRSVSKGMDGRKKFLFGIVAVIFIVIGAWLLSWLYQGSPSDCIQDSDCVLIGEKPQSCVNAEYRSRHRAMPWNELTATKCGIAAIKIRKPGINSTGPFPVDKACECKSNSCQKRNLSELGWHSVGCAFIDYK